MLKLPFRATLLNWAICSKNLPQTSLFHCLTESLSWKSSNIKISSEKFTGSPLLSCQPSGLQVTVPQLQLTRSIIKYDLETGERHSHPGIYKRFTKLHWGAWIRPEIGQNKKLWAKLSKKKHHCQQFYFVPHEKGQIFDKMVTTYYRMRRYYPDDPLRPYHERDNFIGSRRRAGPAHDSLPPPRLTKADFEQRWYDAHNLPKETPYKRPMHKKVVPKSLLE
ncbi:uncharacterized protein LOC108673237 [Hyalella azteca]|uniref:Uncharacterized protein LOC108673237 n=1 Tax=Hyalella azteca TaxID=294128 RepID=A0A8B7NS34_HYAAZ|nr:uncharacterized protein LOC108673237 [Hyalella azteca]